MPTSLGAEILALMIVHTLWQGFLLFGVLKVLFFVGQFREPTSRYAIYRAGLLVLFCCPILTLIGLTQLPGRRLPRVPEISHQTPSHPPFVQLVLEEPSGGRSSELGISLQRDDITPPVLPDSVASVQSPENVSTAVNSTPDQRQVAEVNYGKAASHQAVSQSPIDFPTDQPLWTSVVALLWLLGFAVMTLRLVLGTGGLRRLRRTAGLAPPDWEILLEKLYQQLGLPTTNRIAICLSEHVTSPLILGLFRPLILLPASWVTALSPRSLEALLLHELAHWQRGDLWMIWLQRWAETVLFFHPVTWWLSRRLSRERELCCDDVVIAFTQEPLVYAQVLEFAALASRRADRSQLVLALGGTPMELLHRVKRVLGIAPDEAKNRQGMAGAAIFACSLSAALALFWVPGAILSTGMTPAFADDEPAPPERGERPGPPPPRDPENDRPRPPHENDRPRPPHENDRPRPPHEGDRPRPPHEGDRPRPPHEREGRGPHFDGPPRDGRPGSHGPEDGPPPPPHVVMWELMHAVRELRAEIGALRAEVRELRGSGHGRDGRPPHRPDDRHPPRDGDRPPRSEDFRPRDGSRPPRGPHEPDRPGRPHHPEDRDHQDEARGPQKDGPDKPKPPEDKPKPPAKPDEA